MKKWHVEFDVQSEGEFTYSSFYDQMMMGEGTSSIFVPADAVITEVEQPISDGYYVGENNRRTYRRSGGEWFMRDMRSWHGTFDADGQVREGFMTFLAPLSSDGA